MGPPEDEALVLKDKDVNISIYFLYKKNIKKCNLDQCLSPVLGTHLPEYFRCLNSFKHLISAHQLLILLNREQFWEEEPEEWS